MDEPASFGYWIRRRRKALDLTSDELAQRVGCAGVTIRKIEADERRPSRQIAERLAIYLEIPPADRPAFLQSARAELAVDHLAPPPKPPLSPPPPRRQIDRKPRQHAIKGYDLREPIGEGGFGTVYRAEQPGLGREVAVKIIRPEYANHPEFIRRFEAEAQIVARLEHPHIVPLYDYWRESSGAYLVMRYVRGGSLHTALRSGPWSLEQATRLLDQIGAALAFAHRHSVVHRDLKPANILLDEEGNTYLADFGIAKDLGAADAVGATQPGAIIGSPEHLSPEQIQDAPVTAQSDMFSLGVLLYEVLTGAHPFANLTPGERLYQQLQAPLPPLHARCPDLPGALNAVIQRATAKSPTDRYPDVASMVVGWQHALMEDEGQKAKDAPLLAMTPSSSVLRPSFESVTLTDLAVLENPYKGLRAFGEADAADFFGREALVQRLLERLAEPGVGDQGLGVGNYAEANSRTPIPHPPSSIPRFLAVVGPSGSGKSSVVRAGLIPALRRGGLPGSERWFVVELFPGAHPLEELEAALLRVAVNPPESLLGQLQEDQRGLARAVKRVLPSDEEIELVLVIDQFEELFTLTQDENVRAHILASLVAAVLDPRSRVRVIVTLRADFIDRPLQYVDFGELLRERTEFVLPLAPGELEQAIVGPAARVGVVPEPEVVVAIVENIGERPGALPLLQYALTELFERRQGRTLTLAAYRESGGIRGALARRADETYNKLDASEQEAVRQLFLRLITLGEGAEDTRRRVLHSELSALRKDERRTTNDDSHPTAPSSSVLRRPSAMDAVIDAYGRARLLSFDRDPITREPTVEVAHEALLREWGRLRAWLDASRADIRMQRLLAAAVAEWSAAGRDPSYLLSGVRLAQFEGWAAQTGLVLTLDERAFLDASLAERTEREAAEQARQQRELATARQLAEEQQRRADEQSRAAARLRRRALYLAGALALALLAASAAGIFANNNATLATQNADVARTAQIAGDEANHQRRAAEANLTRAEAERLAAEANRLVVERGNVDVATLLALRSVKMQYTPQGDEAVAGVSQLVYPERILTGHTGYVGRVRFTPDGRYLVSASIDGTVRVWDIQSGVTLHENRYPGWMLQVDISPDGMLFVSSGAEGMVYLTARASDVPQRQLVGHSGFVGGAVFSPDGHYVVTVGGTRRRDYGMYRRARRSAASSTPTRSTLSRCLPMGGCSRPAHW
jgi:serine/threonine protein kinase/DNA-binding XRE family transcriptional regulator